MNRQVLDSAESVSEGFTFTGVVAVITVTQITAGHRLVVEVETEPDEWTLVNDTKRGPLEFAFTGGYSIDIVPGLRYRIREGSDRTGNRAWIGG